MTRKLSGLACLILAAALASARAEEVVVFARGDAQVLGPEAPGSRHLPADQAFLASAKAELAAPPAYDLSYPLINPPAWGRVVAADTGGVLKVRSSYPGALSFHVDLAHLLAGHTYTLCINGRPQHPGNLLLPESVPGHEEEKYLDFYTLSTDGSGAYHAGFVLRLAPGAYNVHFYVKDTGDHKIVLYGLEYFDFTVL